MLIAEQTYTLNQNMSRCLSWFHSPPVRSHTKWWTGLFLFQWEVENAIPVINFNTGFSVLDFSWNRDPGIFGIFGTRIVLIRNYYGIPQKTPILVLQYIYGTEYGIFITLHCTLVEKYIKSYETSCNIYSTWVHYCSLRKQCLYGLVIGLIC